MVSSLFMLVNLVVVCLGHRHGNVGCGCEDELRDFSIFPGSLWWLNAYSVSNAQYNLVPPRLVAQPRTVSDVQRVLQCATQRRIGVAVKAGGHNYAGFSVGSGGIQMDLRAYMCDESKIADVSAQFAEPAIRVGAGCIFEQVYEWLHNNKRGYVLAGGLCPTVGVSGFHMAGGVGPFSRAFGVGAQHILQAQLVTPNGTVVLTANKTHHSDLLFALRGGGGGSFGVVTEWVLRVHSTAQFGTFSTGEFCPDDSVESYQRVLYNLVDALPSMPSWLSVGWRFTTNSQVPQGGLCILYYSFRTAMEGYTWLQQRGIINTTSAPLNRFPHIGDEDGDGTSRDHNGNFFAEYDSYLALALERARYAGERQFNPVPYRTANCILPEFTREAANVLLERYSALAATPNAACFFVGFALPGRPVPPEDSNMAFAYSSARYVAEMDCSLRSDNTYAAAVKVLADWTGAFEQKNLCAGTFLNFPYRNLTSFPTKYWSTGSARLSEIRRFYNPDPDNVLKFEQQVPLFARYSNHNAAKLAAPR